MPGLNRAVVATSSFVFNVNTMAAMPLGSAAVARRDYTWWIAASVVYRLVESGRQEPWRWSCALLPSIQNTEHRCCQATTTCPLKAPLMSTSTKRCPMFLWLCDDSLIHCNILHYRFWHKSLVSFNWQVRLKCISNYQLCKNETDGQLDGSIATNSWSYFPAGTTSRHTTPNLISAPVKTSSEKTHRRHKQQTQR